MRILKSINPILSPKFKIASKYWLGLFFNSVENELPNLSHITSMRSVAVDVGANEGLYSYGMSRLFSTVYSFEANENVIHDLQRSGLKNVKVFNVGLSSAKGQAILYVPFLNGTELTGWGSLNKNNSPFAKEFVKKEISLFALDDFDIADVCFIKIDVEGHELYVLKGAEKTIVRDKPVILVEVREDSVNGVVEYLSSLGYKRKGLRDFVGLDGSEGNNIFVPINP